MDSADCKCTTAAAALQLHDVYVATRYPTIDTDGCTMILINVADARLISRAQCSDLAGDAVSSQREISRSTRWCSWYGGMAGSLLCDI